MHMIIIDDHGAETWGKHAKIGLKIRFFDIFLKFGLLSFLEIA